MRGPLVQAWFGLPGAGKTFAMVAAARKARKHDPALKVWSNFPLRLPVGEPARPLFTVEDWEEARGGLVILDEAHILLGSREWSGPERKRVLAKMGQLRKAGVYLWYSTHDPSKVDKQLRNLTECSHWMTSCRGLGFFFARVRVGASPRGESMGPEIVLMLRSTMEAYDTAGEVGASGLDRAPDGVVPPEPTPTTLNA